MGRFEGGPHWRGELIEVGGGGFLGREHVKNRGLLESRN